MELHRVIFLFVVVLVCACAGTDRACRRALGPDVSAPTCARLRTVALHRAPARSTSVREHCPLRRPHRDVRRRFCVKFLRRCRAAFGRALDLPACLDLQIAAIEDDRQWMAFIADPPPVPGTWDEVVELARRAEEEGVLDEVFTASGRRYVIRWHARLADAQRTDYFLQRDHRGARYGARGTIVFPPLPGQPRVQATYSADGTYIQAPPVAGGSADRYARLRDHVAYDVYWYHATLYAAAGDPTGHYPSEYRRLCPTAPPRRRDGA